MTASPRQLVGLTAAIDIELTRLAEAGVIPTHQSCAGEEAVLVGAALAAEAGDWLFWGRQVLTCALVRGLPLERLFGYAHDMGAVAAEVAALKIVNMTNGAAARLPHATGLAWAGRNDGVVALCELGDGAVSDADFHVGLNFAAVMAAPVVFLVRTEDGPAPSVWERGEGYGVPAVSIDGSDVLEVRDAVRDAAERARTGGGPTLIEARVRRGERPPESVWTEHETAVKTALAAWEKNAR